MIVEVLGPPYRRAPELVVAEYQGEPIRTIDVAQKPEIRCLTAGKALRKAESHGLVTRISRKGWIPTNHPSQ